MFLKKYFDDLDDSLRHPLILSTELKKEQRSSNVGLLHGEILFVDDSKLFFMEYLEVSNKVEKNTYSYHYQNNEGKLLFRYDNSPHHRELKSFPHHKHTERKVIESNEPNFSIVLNEIINDFIIKTSSSL